MRQVWFAKKVGNDIGNKSRLLFVYFLENTLLSWSFFSKRCPCDQQEIDKFFFQNIPRRWGTFDMCRGLGGVGWGLGVMGTNGKTSYDDNASFEIFLEVSLFLECRDLVVRGERLQTGYACGVAEASPWTAKSINLRKTRGYPLNVAEPR